MQSHMQRHRKVRSQVVGIDHCSLPERRAVGKVRGGEAGSSNSRSKDRRLIWNQIYEREEHVSCHALD